MIDLIATHILLVIAAAVLVAAGIDDHHTRHPKEPRHARRPRHR